MKPILILFTSLFFCAANAQQYANITSDWCKMGLKGKVKEMQYTELTPNLSEKKYTLSYITLKFSQEGYITEKTVKQKNKKDIINTYHYQFTDSSYIVTVSYQKGLKPKPQYTYQLYIRGNGNNTITQSFPNDSTGRQQYLYMYNSDQQLVMQVSTPTKKYGIRPTKSFQYDDQGYVIKEVWHYGASHKKHFDYTVISKDINGNPTSINTITRSEYKNIVHNNDKTITYKYYN